MSVVVSSNFQLSRGLIRMVRRLHLAAPAVGSRQRTLLQGMCRLFDAQRGSILISTIDAASGDTRVMASVTLEAPFPPDDVGASVAAASTSRNTTATGKARSTRIGAPLQEGSVHDAFVSLQGVRVAKLSLMRSPGRRRFTPTERGLIDVIHAECAWIHDEPESGDGQSSPRMR
jgi:hypothetical protein